MRAERAGGKLRNEDGTYRRDYLRAVAQRVEVVSPGAIRILGTKLNCCGHFSPLRA